MHCIVRSADRMIVDSDVQRIVARSPHGEFAVMDGHASILAVLVPSIVRIQSDGTEQTIAIKGGTFQVEDNTATLLVERPYKQEDIDVDSLNEELAALRTKEPMTSALQQEIAYLELLCNTKEPHA